MTREEAIVRLENLIDSEKKPRNQLALQMAIDDMQEQEERENPTPLTLDELLEMNEEPVFLVDLVHKSDPETPNLWGGWIVFTSHNTNGFIPRGGGFFSNYGYGKTWLAYRSKPKDV